MKYLFFYLLIFPSTILAQQCPQINVATTRDFKPIIYSGCILDNNIAPTLTIKGDINDPESQLIIVVNKDISYINEVYFPGIQLNDTVFLEIDINASINDMGIDYDGNCSEAVRPNHASAVPELKPAPGSVFCIVIGGQSVGKSDNKISNDDQYLWIKTTWANNTFEDVNMLYASSPEGLPVELQAFEIE